MGTPNAAMGYGGGMATGMMRGAAPPRGLRNSKLLGLLGMLGPQMMMQANPNSQMGQMFGAMMPLLQSGLFGGKR